VRPFGNNERDRRTAEAFSDPRVGDRFTEMYSFWMYVVGREGDCVVTMHASPPCTFPEDAKVTFSTLEEFQKRWAYESIPGYSVSLEDRDNDVSDWLVCDA
jgi:hypothetical protein